MRYRISGQRRVDGQEFVLGFIFAPEKPQRRRQILSRAVETGIELHRFLETPDRVLFVVLPVVRLSHRGVGRRRVGIELAVHRQERERIVGLVAVGQRVGERDEAGVAEVVALAAVVLLAQRLVLLDRRGDAALGRRLGQNVGQELRHGDAAMARRTPHARHFSRRLAGHLGKLRGDLARHQNHLARDGLLRLRVGIVLRGLELSDRSTGGKRAGRLAEICKSVGQANRRDGRNPNYVSHSSR